MCYYCCYYCPLYSDFPTNPHSACATAATTGEELPGVTRAMLYFGSWRSMFGWHTEDMDLFSINFLHTGAPKLWYGIPVAQAERFENLAASTWR